MRHVIRWSCLAAALLTFGSPLEAQKPKPGARGVSGSPEEYKQVLAAGEVTGKVARIDHVRRIITISVETQVVQAGGGNGNQGQQALQNLARQQQQMIRQLMQRPNNNANPAQQARQMQQRMAQAQAANRNNGGGPKLQTVKKEFEFQADEKAKVRLMSLPQEYDERGKPKQYTAAELKQLKGPNANLPGYQADFENLSAGQTVKLHVASARKAAAAPAKPAKDKDVDNDKDPPLVLDATKPRATMVLILKDEGNSTPKGNPKKK